MFIMEQEYADKGYVAYYKLLEMIGATPGHFIDFKLERVVRYYAASIRADKELTLKIVSTLAEIGAIDIELWQQQRIIWCDEFVEKLSHLYSKRELIPQKPGNIIVTAPETKNLNDNRQINTHSIVNNSNVTNIKKNNTNTSVFESQKTFAAAIKKFVDNPYSREMLLAFYDYWSETTQDGKRMLWQTKKTWDLAGRLRTWQRNELKFSNGKTKQGQPTDRHAAAYQVGRTAIERLAEIERGNNNGAGGAGNIFTDSTDKG